MYSESELQHILSDLLGLPAETELVEFKKAENSFSDTELGEYFSALSNEANLKGIDHAWIVFGIDNNTHAVLGTHYKSSRPSLDEMKKKIADQTTNRITFDEIYEVTYTGKRVIMFQVPAAPQGIPVAYQGHYYGRDNESLVALNLHEIELIRGQVSKVDWSAQVVEGATIDDLDKEAIEKAREKYAQKHPHLEEDMKEWSDVQFLNYARVLRAGKVTNTAIILLGKPESEVLISPAVAKLRWIVKDSAGIERDYLIESCPMILAEDRIYDKIRNLKYRNINPALATLFPDEVDTYEPYVIREAMNNAIAHQDYAKGAMINVMEYEDRLIFTNAGIFLPGTIQRVLESENPEDRYQNKFLAQAMVELKMVDTIGSGIRRMFNYQKKRLFPMPVYDFVDERVKVTIIGRVINESYARQLALNTSLTLIEIEMLNRVQLGRPLTDAEVAYLRKKGLVEGRKNNLFLSAYVAAKSKQNRLKADYIKNKSFDDEFFKKQIIAYLEKFGKASRKEIDTLLLPKLSDALNETQKINKVTNLLASLRRNGIIRQGDGRYWFLVK